MKAKIKTLFADVLKSCKVKFPIDDIIHFTFTDKSKSGKVWRIKITAVMLCHDDEIKLFKKLKALSKNIIDVGYSGMFSPYSGYWIKVNRHPSKVKLNGKKN